MDISTVAGWLHDLGCAGAVIAAVYIVIKEIKDGGAKGEQR